MKSGAGRWWVVLMACVIGPSAARADATLYERLGGEQGVAAIADMLVDRVSSDQHTRAAFEDVKLARLKRLVAEHVCELSSGNCRYSGVSMREAHAGLNISEVMFYRMVEILRDVLHERHVDQRSINQLLRLLAPMKRDIVEHGRAGPTAGAVAGNTP